jgi:SAM-dependent methyltransferase
VSVRLSAAAQGLRYTLFEQAHLQTKRRVFHMKARFLKLGKKVVHYLGIGRPDNRIQKLYEERDYLEAYSQHTDIRVESDPHEAVGGMWEEIGKLQFNFLLSRGLQPYHKMLDIGCGTLRGGRHFIRHLNDGNYVGIDISTKAIEYGKQLIQHEGLKNKKPRFLINENGNLQVREFSEERFDYILAQSVFTHLKPEHIKECFKSIGRIMHENSVFYFTYSQGKEYEQTGLKDFRYPFSFFELLAKHHGFKLHDCSDEYNHPRGQRMVELRQKQ